MRKLLDDLGTDFFENVSAVPFELLKATTEYGLSVDGLSVAIEPHINKALASLFMAESTKYTKGLRTRSRTAANYSATERAKFKALDRRWRRKLLDSDEELKGEEVIFGNRTFKTLRDELRMRDMNLTTEKRISMNWWKMHLMCKYFEAPGREHLCNGTDDKWTLGELAEVAPFDLT